MKMLPVVLTLPLHFPIFFYHKYALFSNLEKNPILKNCLTLPLLAYSHCSHPLSSSLSLPPDPNTTFFLLRPLSPLLPNLLLLAHMLLKLIIQTYPQRTETELAIQTI